MKNYAVTVSFLDPVEGVAYISAENDEEVKKKVEDLFSNREKLKIVDIKEQDEIVDFFDILDVPKELN